MISNLDVDWRRSITLDRNMETKFEGYNTCLEVAEKKSSPMIVWIAQRVEEERIMNIISNTSSSNGWESASLSTASWSKTL